MDKFMVLKLLAEKTRFNIFIKLLEYDELCVCELEEILGLKQANTSKHLNKFKEMNLLTSRREGNLIKYSINPDFINEHEGLIIYLVQ